MLNLIVLALFQNRRALSYQLSLALGAIFATLGVVAYAAAASAESALRAHIVLQGMEMILLTLTAAVLAGALHGVSTLGESSQMAARIAPQALA